MVKQINEEEFNSLIAESKLPVFCDFWATWCGPCKMLAPVMDKISDEFEGRAVFVKVDVDENGDLAAKYGVHSIPMVLCFVGGEKKDESLGFVPFGSMKKFVEKNL